MMFYTFRHIGITTDVAEDGQQAVNMAGSTNYDIILLDINMPIMNGYDATKIIRKDEEIKGHHAFIIGLTGNVYDQEREKCINAGMDEYLTKPFDIDRFKYLLSLHNLQVL